MRLSENFKLHELTKSSTAARHGIDNTPNAAQIENLKLVAEKILEPVRANYHRSIYPSSGFRCFELEKVICKKSIEGWLIKHPGKTVEDYLARKSHPTGTAVDFEISGIDNRDLFNWIRDNLVYDQLIAEFYKPGIPNSGWIHASWRRDGNRQQAFEIKD